MRKLLFVFGFALVPSASFAATCVAGQYLSNGVCTLCDKGYYCPGDDARHNCTEGNVNYYPWYSDTVGATECKSCPVIAKEGVLRSVGNWYATTVTVHDRISYCFDAFYYAAPHGGEFRVNCRYNPDTGMYDSNCYGENPKCGAGYYYDESWTTRATRSWYGTYPEILESDVCIPTDAGYYSPAADVEQYACTDDNTYSDAGAAACSPCPDKTGNNSTTAAGHAGIASCRALCGGGVTKLHVRESAFNIWPSGQCGSPALQIGLNGNVCCVNLLVGTGTGINIKYDTTTYHTVN